MNDKKHYKGAFSQIHTDLIVKEEDFKRMKKMRASKTIGVAAAAVVCIGLAGFGTVYATNLFGVKDMIIGTGSAVTITRPPTEGDIDQEPVQELIPSETVALQGYADSIEFKAAQEWKEFQDHYDQDGVLISEIGNGPTELDEKYSEYFVYTQEMADALDAIASKYGLQLHKSMEIASNNEEFLNLTQTQDFLGTVNTVGSGYVFNDGTFQYDGTAVLSNGKTIEYQLRNCVKGILDEVFLNIGDSDEYEQWTYETASGVLVTIASSPYKSLITVDLEGSFLNMNILPELSPNEITNSDLEMLADSIDFSMINN